MIKLMGEMEQVEIPETKITVKHYIRIYEKGWDDCPSLKNEIQIDNRDHEKHLDKLPNDYVSFEIFDITEFEHGNEILRSKPRNVQMYVRSACLITIDEAISKYKKENYFNELKKKGFTKVVAIRELVTFLPFKDNIIVINDGLDTGYKDYRYSKCIK